MRHGLGAGAGLLVLVLCSLVVTGCAGTVSTGGTFPAVTNESTGPIWRAQASTSTVASEPNPVPGGSEVSRPKAAAGPSAADLAAMKAQLDAMQKEIDALALPSDNDFSDAAGAVY